jgi:hypothetical protein
MDNEHREMMDRIERALSVELPGAVRHFAPGLARWAVFAIEPGSYLAAVLRNDLAAAYRCGDAVSLANVAETLGTIRRVMPADCHGSGGLFDAWRGLAAEDGEE